MKLNFTHQTQARSVYNIIHYNPFLLVFWSAIVSFGRPHTPSIFRPSTTHPEPFTYRTEAIKIREISLIGAEFEYNLNIYNTDRNNRNNIKKQKNVRSTVEKISFYNFHQIILNSAAIWWYMGFVLHLSSFKYLWTDLNILVNTRGVPADITNKISWNISETVYQIQSNLVL